MSHVDIYLHMDGIKGESADHAFKDEIELASFSHNMHQAGSQMAGTAGGATAGRVQFGDFTIIKPFDLSSPKLMEFCSKGNHINNVWVQLRRAGGTQNVYYEFHFKDCVITSITKSGDANHDNLPTETVTFNYSEYKEVYHKQAREGGGIAGSLEFAWNLKGNAPA